MSTEQLSSMQDMLTLRMFGQNVAMRRYQWLELLDELHDDSMLADRINWMLEDKS